MQETRIVEYTNSYGLKDRWTYRGSKLISAEIGYPKLNKKEKLKIMSQKEQLFEQIDALYQQFVAEHNGKTKKSQANARKALGEIKKLVTDYRKASVEEGK